MSQIICITGMHRSGTSLTTSWLALCGLPVHDGKHHGPNVGNPKGHFEDKDFVDIHVSAIKAKYPSSKGWKVLSPEKLFFSEEHLNHAKNLVQKRSEKFSFWGWKDPRSVMFLDDWKNMIPALKVLLIWRPCDEVVRSLVNRSRKAELDVFKISARESVNLWKAYNTRVYEYKEKFPDDTLLLPLESILNKDKEALSKISHMLQDTLDYEPIASVFDKPLLKRKKHSLFSRMLSRIYECGTLERKLMSLSNIKGQ